MTLESNEWALENSLLKTFILRFLQTYRMSEYLRIIVRRTVRSVDPLLFFFMKF